MPAWTREEEFKLFQAILKSTNVSIDWSKVDRPDGRTLDGCKQHYQAMMRAAAGTVRGTAGGTASKKNKTTSPRKRKPTSKVNENDHDDDEEHSISPKKKHKIVMDESQESVGSSKVYPKKSASEEPMKEENTDSELT